MSLEWLILFLGDSYLGLHVGPQLLGARDTAVNKTDKETALWNLHWRPWIYETKQTSI